MTEVTYGRLDEVLHALGFSARIAEENAHVYKHDATGALIVLPVFPSEAKVLPQHLTAVRVTLDGYGIADPLDLSARLQKAS